ncbi:MAG: SDR family oxidoreductase, partial [Bacteroidota bacterium]
MKSPQIALVTGANRGIGFEVCRQLAGKGLQVILTSRDAEKGKRAAADLANEVAYYQMDVGNTQSVQECADWVLNTYGGLDVLINNAGINYDMWHTVLNADLEECQTTLDVNLFGPWRVAQAFIPLMRNRSSARVVNVSSEAGALNGMGGGTPAYSISKAALNALTIKLAAATKQDGILVNAVCPGWVRTEMGGANAPRSVAQGAKSIIWAASLPNDGPTG